MAKIALMGFSGLKLFPVTQNDANGYAVGPGFDLPGAQEMTKDPDSSETKIYADDTIYLNFTAWNGLKTTITIAEMTLEMMARLGFGIYDEDTGELAWNPQGQNLSFALALRLLRADGNYRMQKMYNFTVSEVKESGTKSKGSGDTVNPYQLTGTFTTRAFDGLPGAIKDTVTAADLTWLDTIDSEGTAEA
jgi:phi13 family phage major tail protein